MDSAKNVAEKRALQWRKIRGVIHFSVTSDGETGEGWVTRLRKKNILLSECAVTMLRDTAFQPTSGVTTEIVVLRGSFFMDHERNTNNIREEGKRRHLLTPNAEVACLIREKFTNKELEEMGLLWVVVMHEPIKDEYSDPRLLASINFYGDPWLDAAPGELARKWNGHDGFVFALPQANASV
jgi:hypothetical protein